MFRQQAQPLLTGLRVYIRLPEETGDLIPIVFDPSCSVLVAHRKVKRLITVPEHSGFFLQRKETEFLRMKENVGLREYDIKDGVRGLWILIGFFFFF